VLELFVDHVGRPRVLYTMAGSDPDVAAACTKMLEAGPRWTPARDRSGQALESQVRFNCNVQLNSIGKELWIRKLSTVGPLTPLQLDEALGQDRRGIVSCFETAVILRDDVRGEHWLAFEIGRDGRVLRTEWLSATERSPITFDCVSKAVAELSFPARKAATIADVQFYVSGTSAR
jgi:hypothetical protein